MFDTARLDHRIDKATYRREEPKLRTSLLLAQFDIKTRGEFPVLVVIAGMEGAGKGETVNLLHTWMDPRHIQTVAFDAPSPEEQERPHMWRYWRTLPARGRLGIFFGAWHTEPIVERAEGRWSNGKFEKQIAEALRFERMLADEGVLLIKFWLHLTRQQQKRRLRELTASKKTAWRVGEHEWQLHEHYKAYSAAAEHYVRSTSTGHAPWIVVSGADENYRSLTVGRTLLTAVQERLKQPKRRPPKETNAALAPAIDRVNPIRALRLDRQLSKDDYEGKLDRWQGKLNRLSRHPRFRKHTLVAVFEGNDAAGKGGAIRRVTQALDARQFTIVPVAAPSDEERAQPYLWRFWRHLPRRGRVLIFDRSWYGRVLVERVEKIATEAAWMRAYHEINDFEDQLYANGIIVVKFWLAIDRDEQLKRFKAREKTPFKQFKITDDDWRNRKKWDDYEAAVCEMVDRTSSETAPWTLVEANNKYFARLKVLKTLCTALEARLER